VKADLGKRPAEVAGMFDDVAAGYDRTNDVLSLGQDRLWRRAVTRAVAAQRGERILDIAAGTGTSAQPFVDAGARVVACDFSLGMLRVGRRSRPSVPFVAGDALQLPAGDEAFDAVTISFGLRNVADVDAALAEMHRVTRPGGRLVVCEFAMPAHALLAAAYDRWLQALPAIARRFATNAAAYGYLAESIRAWPAPAELARRIAAAGWSAVGWRIRSGGIVALHTARKGPATVP
jgi:demethylmenaquinone methyltransferase/2-methoxy-6-polyprenyl-1,4-benzoquinol methylase